MVSSLSAAVEANHPTPYRHMKPVYEATATWHGDGAQPAESWSCDYTDGDIYVFTLWPDSGGTEIGFFPLGGPDESLNTPLLGQWKQLDPSLRSIGPIEPRLLTLYPPRLTDDYYDATLRLAGKQQSPANRALLTEQTALMFTLKVQGYIAAKDQRRAERFVDQHLWNGDSSLPQRVLEDVAAWDFGVVPYLQDLPWRIRGLLLEPGRDGKPSADIWRHMS